MIRSRALASAAFLLLLGIAAAILWLRPLDFLTRDVPPIEAVTVERVELDSGGITVRLRGDGSQPVSIVQVQVDGAYWRFETIPPGPIPRLGTAVIRIPYPWMEGAVHELVFVTATGITIPHTIEVAVATPTVDPVRLAAYALIGLLVGVVPVGLGTLFYPALAGMGRSNLGFLLSLTVGLLLFLLLDTVVEGLDAAASAPSALGAREVFWLVALLTTLALLLAGRWTGGAPEGRRLAFFVALGIGLHNLGEGLAIGAAFSAGEVALASFLVVGFMLHNFTEGIGIAAPLVGHRPKAWLFLALVALAGLPTVPGTWAGAFAVTPFWIAVCFGVAAGAILQVVVELAVYIHRLARREGATWLNPRNAAGFASGVGIMYGTALLVTL